MNTHKALALSRTGWFGIVIAICLGMALSGCTSLGTHWFPLPSNFEAASLNGWQINAYSAAIATIRPSSQQAFDGQRSLELLVNLRDQTNYRSGEIYVDVIPKQDLSGQTVSAWIYAPKGARGNPEFPNGIHLFVEDTLERKLYGTWYNMVENSWFQITLPIANSLPACGSIDPGFNPKAVKKIGINLGAAEGGGIKAAYSGSIFIDKVSLVVPEPLTSDHVYTFDRAEDLTQILHWDVDPDWGATAWNKLSINDRALVADAAFAKNSETGRKGFLQILYSPYLNLGHKNHHTISLDVRFEPAAATEQERCPFVITLWVWDEQKQKWFANNYQHVGSGNWTRVSFNLDNPAEFDSTHQSYPGDLPTLTDIKRVGVQLYANADYTGKVMFDNIVIGGKELPKQYASQNYGFVKTQGSQFILNGREYRFVGVNAEYLFKARESDMAIILDAARRIGPTVVRTWGFSEGQEKGCDNENVDCVAYSPYFQPARGKWNTTTLENFDRLVAMAGERGLRLIVPLVNNWDEYGGIPQYVEWLKEKKLIAAGVDLGTEAYAQHDIFFTDPNARQWYKNHVKTLLTRTNHITGIRYVDDPTILAWEVINEPRAKSDVSGAILHTWLKEMSDYVRSLDHSHLIGSGTEGWYIMPGAQTEQFNSWQNFSQEPNKQNNYWLYGVNWWADCAGRKAYGSNGTDFISDHASKPIEVAWQTYYGPKCKTAPVQKEKRAEMMNIDYTSLHLYVAEHEADLYRAPYLQWGFPDNLFKDYTSPHFQAEEWVKQHVRDSHDNNEIGKPLVVAEFGLHLSEIMPKPDIDGAQGKNSPEKAFQYTPAFNPEQRQVLYKRYLDMMYDAGVNGILFWNLGNSRFNDMLWDGCESPPTEIHPTLPKGWDVSLDSDATLIQLNSTPERVSWGKESIQVNYSPIKKQNNVVIHRVNIHENWEKTAKFEIDLYNQGNATQASVALVTGPGEVWYESQRFPIESGWNMIAANALMPYWTCKSEGCSVKEEKVDHLDDVRQLSITLYGYTKPGTVYIDYVRHQGNDSLVIYPDNKSDPIFVVIVTEAKRWFSTLQTNSSKPLTTQTSPAQTSQEMPFYRTEIGKQIHRNRINSLLNRR